MVIILDDIVSATMVTDSTVVVLCSCVLVPIVVINPCSS